MRNYQDQQRLVVIPDLSLVKAKQICQEKLKLAFRWILTASQIIGTLSLGVRV
jgi:hypothetical protein